MEVDEGCGAGALSLLPKTWVVKAVKAIYEKGKIKLAEKPAHDGPMEVLVVFPETADDPWQAILDDPTPRPALAQWVRDVKKEIAQGKAKPLELDRL